MNKPTLFTILFAIGFFRSFSQNTPLSLEEWDSKPIIHNIVNKYSKESAVILYDKRRIEYVDDVKGEVEEYYTFHRIIHLNDDRGIETFNKIYLDFSDESDIIDVKARSILPNGRIVELDKKNIKDIKEGDGNSYKIFAMEGLEKGCEVEFFYTFKRPTSYFGREVLQVGFPIEKSEFQIACPARLRFDFKPYNFNCTGTDSVLNQKRLQAYVIENIPAIENEKYAFERANARRLEFKLSYNDTKSNGIRLFTWNEFAKRVYAAYTGYSEKDNKIILGLVAKQGWADIADEPRKIMAVENYIKKSIIYNREISQDLQNTFEVIFKEKAAGVIGTVRLYSAIFKALGIKYQFVFPADREKCEIDKDFENWNNCENPILYFPEEKKFMTPTLPEYRYPYIDPSNCGINALFCKETSLGSYFSALAEIKKVELDDYKENVDNIESHLVFNGSFDTLNMDTKQIYSGYAAIGIRDAFNNSTEEQKKNIIKELVKNVTSSDHIQFSEILNQEFENINTNTPLIIHAKTKSAELIEKTGSKLLLKIGLAIGEQVEMYQEKPRQMPINIRYPQVEERKIEFSIPEGYTIVNLDDLKISQTYTENGEVTMGFVSNYEMKDQKLFIHIMEEYHKIYFPITVFDQYRKIINASSDFNKVVLVLEKK